MSQRTRAVTNRTYDCGESLSLSIAKLLNKSILPQDLVMLFSHAGEGFLDGAFDRFGDDVAAQSHKPVQIDKQHL